MDQILEIVGKLLGVALVVLVAYLTPKIKEWLNEKIGETNTNHIIVLIENFVTAADQLFKSEDPTGEIRNKYVKDQLTKLGYVITDEINSFIESAVKKCNKEYNKK